MPGTIVLARRSGRLECETCNPGEFLRCTAPSLQGKPRGFLSSVSNASANRSRLTQESFGEVLRASGPERGVAISSVVEGTEREGSNERVSML